MWLELIGDSGGDAYSDFKHLDAGIPFQLQSEQTYDVGLYVCAGELAFEVTDSYSRRWSYTARLADRPLGRVGLRPWRSRVKCGLFKVSQL
jgi:hypothetical protein